MGTLIPLLFLMGLIPFLFLHWSQAKELEITETQRLFRQRFLIGSAVTVVPLFLLLLISGSLGPGWVFFTSIMPFPFFIAMLCYYWKYPRSPKDTPTVWQFVGILVVMIYCVLISAMGYYIQVDALHHISERLPPAVPTPPDFTLPNQMQNLEQN